MIFNEEPPKLPLEFILPNGIKQIITHGRFRAGGLLSDTTPEVYKIFLGEVTFFTKMMNHFIDINKLSDIKLSTIFRELIHDREQKTIRGLFSANASSVATIMCLIDYLEKHGFDSNKLKEENLNGRDLIGELIEIVPFVTIRSESEEATIAEIKKIIVFEKDWWKKYPIQPQQQPLSPCGRGSKNLGLALAKS